MIFRYLKIGLGVAVLTGAVLCPGSVWAETIAPTQTLAERIETLKEKIEAFRDAWRVLFPGTAADEVLKVGDRIRVRSFARVRANPGLTEPTLRFVLWRQGTVLEGPVSLVDASWYKINYENGVQGWNLGSTIVLVKAASEPGEAKDDTAPDTGGERGVAALLRDAATRSPQCVALGDFYWAIGNSTGVLYSGSTGSRSVTADTVMDIASASKFLYAAYVIEKNKGVLNQSSIDKLRFTSGYTNTTLCWGSDTAEKCFNRGINSAIVQDQVGKFNYGPGHMLALAAEDPVLKDLSGIALGEEIGGVLGISLRYLTPRLAGGGITSAEEYQKFLVSLVKGDLYLKGLLGAHSVCASVTDCPATATYTPLPAEESWRYSLGHWVETDPQSGDGSFSSPGAFGFYPWVDAKNTYWGIVARKELSPDGSAAVESVRCGQVLRKIFIEN